MARDNIQFFRLAPFRPQGRAARAVQAPDRPLSAPRAARHVHVRLAGQQPRTRCPMAGRLICSRSAAPRAEDSSKQAAPQRRRRRQPPPLLFVPAEAGSVWGCAAATRSGQSEGEDPQRARSRVQDGKRRVAERHANCQDAGPDRLADRHGARGPGQVTGVLPHDGRPLDKPEQSLVAASWPAAKPTDAEHRRADHQERRPHAARQGEQRQRHRHGSDPERVAKHRSATSHGPVARQRTPPRRPSSKCRSRRRSSRSRPTGRGSR